MSFTETLRTCYLLISSFTLYQLLPYGACQITVSLFIPCSWKFSLFARKPVTWATLITTPCLMTLFFYFTNKSMPHFLKVKILLWDSLYCDVFEGWHKPEALCLLGVSLPTLPSKVPFLEREPFVAQTLMMKTWGSNVKSLVYSRKTIKAFQKILPMLNLRTSL